MRLRRLLILLPIFVALGAVGAYAWFSSTGSGSATASTGTLDAPGKPSGSVTGGTVDLSWSAATVSGGGTVKYHVERGNDPGSTWTDVCGSTDAAPITATSCSDTPGNGTFVYRVTSRYASWHATGAESDPVTVAVSTDTTPPYVLSIDRVEATPTNAGAVHWTVTFSENVTGVDITDFSLTGTGATGASISTVSGGGDTYAVTASTGNGGSLRLDLIDDDSIADGAGNPLGTSGGAGDGSFTGQAYTIDKTAPTVTAINRHSSSPTNASSVQFDVSFSESVTGVDATDFALVNSGVSGASISGVSGSGASYAVTVNSGSGDGTIGLNLVDDDSILDAVGNMLGGTGAGNGNFTGQVYAIDKTAPVVTVTQVNGVGRTFPYSTTANVSSIGGACRTGDSAVNVTIDGSPAVPATASCASGSWTLSLTTPLSTEGSYTLAAAQSDAAGNNGSSGSKTITIDKTAPTISAVVASTYITLTPTAGFFKSGGQYVVLANASDANGVASVTATVSNIAPSSPTTVTLTPCFGLACTASNGITYAYTSAVLTAGSKLETGNPFSFTASATDAAGNGGTFSGAARVDNTSPTGGSITPPNTNTYNTSGSVAITLSKGTDPSSGGSGIVTSGNLLQRASTSLASNACGGAYGSFATVATDPSLSTSDATVATGNCYKWQYVVFDNVGNSTTYTSSNVVKVDTTVPSVSAGTITGTENTNGKTGCQFINGSNVWFSTATSANGNTISCGNTNGQGPASGSFTVPATASDVESGIVKVTFPTSGLTNVTGGGDDTSSPYSTTYGWTAASPASSGSASAITALDNAGLTGTASFSIALDNTAPTVSTPSVTAGYYTTLSVPVGTPATDNAGGSGVASISVQRASATLTNNVCGTFGSFSTTVTLSAGNDTTVASGNCYEYQEQASDNVGNQSAASATSSVAMIDTTSPVLTIGTLTGSASPSSCQFISASAAFYSTTNANNNSCSSASGSFTVPATATDTQSGIAKVGFPAIDNGITGGGDDLSSPYATTYSWNAGSTFSGPGTVTAFNNAGLTSTATFTATLDNTAPTVSTPTVTAGYYTSLSVPVATSATDTGGAGVASTTVQRASATLTNNVCGTFGGFSTVTLSSGNDTTVASGNCYEYQELATDRVGNQSALSATSNVAKVDTSAPSAPSVSLANATGNTFVSGTTVYINNVSGKSGGFQVSATTSDTESGILKVNFPAFGSSGGGDVSSAPYQTTYSWSGAVTAGAKTVTATNNATLTATNTFTITSDVTPPTITAGAKKADNTTYTAGTWTNQTVTVHYTCSDAGSGIAGCPADQVFSSDMNASTSGTATDNVGNTASVSFGAIEIDKTSPAAGAVTVPSAIRNGQALTDATASDPSVNGAASAIASVKYFYCAGFCTPIPGINLIGTSGTASPYSVTWNSQPADGTYSLLALATDNAGNTATSTVATATIDNTNPTGSITAPTNGGTVGATVTVSSSSADGGSGVASAQFQVAPHGGAFSNLGSPVTGSPYQTSWDTTTIANGSYDLRVTTTDNVGNSFTSPIVTVTVSNTFQVSVTSPQTAGTAFSVSITALAAGSTNTSFSGTQAISFSGPGSAPDGTAPSYPASVTFTNGVGTANITVFKAETTTLTATSGNVTGTSASFTVNPGSASRLAWTSVTNTHGTPSGICLFTCTYTAVGGSGSTFQAKLMVTDSRGNTVSNLGSSLAVTVTKVGGAFTGSSTVTIPASGLAISNSGGDGTVAGEITYTTDSSGNWGPDSLTAAAGSFTGTSAASASFSK